MVFGKLRRTRERIKADSRKVWGMLGRARSATKPAACAIATANAPDSRVAVAIGVSGVAEGVGKAIFGTKAAASPNSTLSRRLQWVEKPLPRAARDTLAPAGDWPPGQHKEFKAYAVPAGHEYQAGR
jgi:hypothetical protein